VIIKKITNKEKTLRLRGARRLGLENGVDSNFAVGRILAPENLELCQGEGEGWCCWEGRSLEWASKSRPRGNVQGQRSSVSDIPCLPLGFPMPPVLFFRDTEATVIPEVIHYPVSLGCSPAPRPDDSSVLEVLLASGESLEIFPELRRWFPESGMLGISATLSFPLGV